MIEVAKLMPESDRKIIDRFKQAGREFRPAFRTALPYMLVGFLFGLVILAAHASLVGREILGEGSFGAKLMEHFGVGLLVAAVAVFGYEWSAHIPKANELTENLILRIGQAEKIADTLVQGQRLLKAMEEQEELRKIRAEEGLGKCLRATLRLEEENPKQAVHDVAVRCAEFINQISTLEKRDKWTDSHYIEFVSGLFQEIIIRNSRSLAALWGEKRAEDGEQHFLFNLGARDIGDRILAAHMEALSAGDFYHVISDLTSWDHRQLQRFRSATKHAIEEEGVVVRRIFDLRRHRNLKRQWIRGILTSHVRDAREWNSDGGKGRYEVMVLGPEEYQRAREEDDYLTEEKISHAHFGLFIHQKSSVVRVQVKEPDLSDLMLSTATGAIEVDLDGDGTVARDSFMGIVKDDLRIFRGLYRVARKLGNDADVDNALDRVFEEEE